MPKGARLPEVSKEKIDRVINAKVL